MIVKVIFPYFFLKSIMTAWVDLTLSRPRQLQVLSLQRKALQPQARCHLSLNPLV